MDRDRGFLLAALVLFGAVSALLVLPFLQYVLLAVLLGYVLYPLHGRLERHVGSRPSAALLIVATAVAVLFPLGSLLLVAARQALSVLTAVSTGQLGIDAIESFVRERTGFDVDIAQLYADTGIDLAELLGSLGGQRGMALLGNLTSVLGGLSNALIGVTVLLFVLYYLLKDGDAFVSWTRRATPVPEDVWVELVERVDRLMWAVLVGNVLVAVVQGVLTGIGLAAVGFSNVVFWTVLTVVLALLPLIGASVVWIPAAAYLLFSGRPLAAAALFAYGATAVSLSDNYLRPVIGGREGNLNPGLFVLGIFGGLFVFGFMGLFFGPVILGTFKVLVEVFSRRTVRVRYGS